MSILCHAEVIQKKEMGHPSKQSQSGLKNRLADAFTENPEVSHGAANSRLQVVDGVQVQIPDSCRIQALLEVPLNINHLYPQQGSYAICPSWFLTHSMHGEITHSLGTADKSCGFKAIFVSPIARTRYLKLVPSGLCF